MLLKNLIAALLFWTLQLMLKRMHSPPCSQNLVVSLNLEPCSPIAWSSREAPFAQVIPASPSHVKLAAGMFIQGILQCGTSQLLWFYP